MAKRNHGKSVVDHLSPDDKSFIIMENEDKIEELFGKRIDCEIAVETTKANRQITRSKRDNAKSVLIQSKVVGKLYDKALEAGANKAKVEAAKQAELKKLFEEAGIDSDVW